MAEWTVPLYSRGEVERAGRVIVDPLSMEPERGIALAIVNNWRSAHSFPLNTFQISLRRRATKIDQNALVAQRLKRLPSIVSKLERFSNMNLARMQDLGGCRAVVDSVDNVRQVRQAFRDAQHKHKLATESDYLLEPKPSGYRGIHMIYQYRSDRTSTWNGLRVEVQIRSRLQHAWATAVETVGLFTQQALKSSVGEERWLRFFALMSSEIALIEGEPLVPGTPTDPVELRAELRGLVLELDVVNRLAAYAVALRESEEQVEDAKFYLLTLDVEEQSLIVRGFRSQEQASEAYAAVEGGVDDGVDVVLVSVSSMAALRIAYPNYFLDTTRFSETVERVLRDDSLPSSI